MAPELNQTRKTVDIGAQYREARVLPSSFNEERRTVDVVWVTETPVLRGFFDRFFEVLSVKSGDVRLGRLENGAPLLDSHNRFDLGGVIGVVETVRLEKEQGVATLRFTREGLDPAADLIFEKVRDGIITNVSVGYSVHRFEQVEGGDEEIPVFRAVDWEPFEISMVPVGADPAATVRAKSAPTNPCEFVSRGATGMAKEKSTQGVKTPNTPDVEKDAPKDETRSADVDAAVKAAKEGEKERQMAIRSMGTSLDLGEEAIAQMVADDLSIDQARARAIELHAEKRKDAPAEQIGSQIRVEGARDLSREGAVEGLRNALLHRMDPNSEKLNDAGRKYRGMRLLEQARLFMEDHGINTRGLTPMQLAGLALGMPDQSIASRAAFHSTSDYPLLLADTMGKTLRRAYEEGPQTFQAWMRRVTLPDFKEVKRTQFGEAPQMLLVPEGAEFTQGTIGEGREVYSLLTYGRTFAVTRQTLINDDLDAMSRIPAMFGRSARDLESDLVYNHFLSNPTMGDAVALFNAAHNNIGTGVINIANIGAAREAMRKQVGLDAKQRINVQMRSLLVPAALETVAEQFVSTNLQADQAGNVNVFAGRLQVISEPRLDDDSAVQWYGLADPAAIDTQEYGYLEGEDGPRIEQRFGWEVDGLQIKAALDFGTKVIDWRGLYRSSGV